MKYHASPYQYVFNEYLDFPINLTKIAEMADILNVSVG